MADNDARHFATVAVISALVAWFVLAVFPGVARCWVPPTTAERALVERALECNRARAHNRDPFLLLELLRLETHPEVRVPHAYRGTILAVACHESGFSPRAIGDGGLALGLTQLHWFHRHGRGCVLDNDVPQRTRVRNHSDAPDTTHPIGNALCWLTRVRQAADRFAQQGCKRAWVSGWGWIAKGVRCCGCTSHRHLRVLRRWQRSIRNDWQPLVAMSHNPIWGSDEPI